MQKIEYSKNSNVQTIVRRNIWRHKIKLGSKPGDKEGIAYRKQLSTGNLKKLRDHQKTRESINRKESYTYNTLLRNVLLYN